MEIQGGQIITPNKKSIVLDALNEEINSLNDKINNQQLNKLVAGSLSNSRMTLQNLLNTVLDKKGVITPSETDNIRNQLEAAKKSRLEGNYVSGMRKGVLYLLGFIAIGAAIYWYNKKND